MRNFTDILQDVIERDPHLTQAGLAIRANLDNSTIRQMIARKRSPNIETALKICRALGTTLEDFITEVDDPRRRELRSLVDNLTGREIDILIGSAKVLRELAQPED